ncbi:MAG: S1C family serine protease [Myxococcota bacterium]
MACAALCACAAPLQQTTTAVGSPSAARRGVVIVLAHRADGKTGFGSGVLLAGSGDIITNRHVTDGATSLGVLFYDPKRPSYAAEDGGLGRYVFENEAAVRPAGLVRDSTLLDFALIHVEADTSAYPKLEARSEPVEPGEQVYAIGHPGESVWSITQGLVSAVHNGLVQTDAAISFGNSGGPLVDAQGRLVGINTSRLFGDVEGVGFARPVSLVQSFIDNSAEADLDLSTPATASVACTRAVEIASSRIAPCIAANDFFDVRAASMDEATALLQLPEPARSIVQTRGTMQTREEWVADYVRSIQAYVANTPDDHNERVKALADQKAPLTGAVRRQILKHIERPDVKARLGRLYDATSDQLRGEQLAREQRRTGKNYGDDAVALRKSIRMGVRVDEVVMVDEGRAWVLAVGRNPDGTTYRDTEYWVRAEGGWTLRLPRPDEVNSSPAAWPPPEAFADRVRFSRDMKIVWLLAQVREPDAS